MATACACLIGGEAIATQFLRPIRGEETMSRAGHGVLVYARSGCENAADDIGFVTGGGRDDKNIAHVPEHSEIGVECADLFLAFIDQQAISAFAPEGLRRFLAHSGDDVRQRSEEHTSELQSLMRISYAVFCLKKKTTT